jgi:endonuclease YncB( thermonuclease family)
MAQQRAQPALPCGGEIIARGTASRFIDGRTFALEDGREVRLAAIEVPAFPLPQTAGEVPSGAGTKEALTTLLAGAEVILRQGESQKTDRYGRIVAYAYTAPGGAERLVQADLIAAGLARVAASVGSRSCAAELLARESAARGAKLGLWASSYYDTLSADNPAEVLAARGRFALVEGRVVSVRESGATIYVNFGRRWTEDFTVTILKRNARTFAAAGLEPKTLAGRRVRVRGWIEEGVGLGSRRRTRSR